MNEATLTIEIKLLTRVDLGDGTPPFDVETSHVVVADEEGSVDPVLDCVRRGIISARREHARAVGEAT